MYETDQVSPNDIAIVGMALRVPGARNTREFWDNLRNGVESIRDVTEEELLAAGENPQRMQMPNYVRRTAELPEMEMFDADFFGLSPKEAAIMDPQHRHFLECAWEAMEDAGRMPDSAQGQVGVFAGCGMGSYFYFNVCSNQQLVDQVGMFLLRHTGNDKDFLSTRASFVFDLRGPSINIQTACSTSLVAIHTACQSLLAGECEMALAGGVTIELPHRRGYLFQEGEILSTDGHCRPFDHQADGTVFGSGVGVVVLRRLSDAIADGDIIHAVIKGTAVNNDGSSKAGYLAPSVTGQAEAVIEAQGLAGVSADEIQYVECHGTGTYLGDPIEVTALTQAFRQSTGRTGFCHIGSVKSNIGHLDTAAGVVSVIKTVLALKHAEIPPTLNFTKPNPAIDFASSPFVVSDRLTPWPKTEGVRRAAVNSLGVGGTNAHAIIEEAPRSSGRTAEDAAPQLFLYSARNRKALDAATQRLGDELVRDPSLRLSDAAYTLFAGRRHFEHRRVIAARDRADAVALHAGAEPRRVHSHSVIEGANAVFLFPGGGAQHVGMAGRLYSEDADFRAAVDEGLGYLGEPAASGIRRVWFDTAGDASHAAMEFLRPSIQLPAILIVEVAIARMWMRQGVQPSALTGHSMGQNAAACIAGVMTFRDAVNLVRLRGELFEEVEAGGMLSVPLSADALASHMNASLDLASVNAPELCVVSGRNEDLEALRARLAAQGIDATRVAIDIAAHSRMLDPILSRFEAFLRGIALRAPRIPLISNLTGEWLSDSDAVDPDYWVRHLRSTVQFARGIRTIATQPGRVYLEVGPGRALSSLVKLQPGIEANQVINSLPHADEKTDDRVHFLAALGRAWATGLNVEPGKLWDPASVRRVSLPTYPFQHQRYFIERQARSDQQESLLVRRGDLADWGYRPVWKQKLADTTADAEAALASWLLFLDDLGIGEELAERLRAGGHRVATVRLGDNFNRLGADEYVLCPKHGRPGYEALFSGLMMDGGIPERFVHLWLLTEGKDDFDRHQELGFHSLFLVAQSLGAFEASPIQMTVVTNGMQRVGNEALPYPDKATVLGPAGVLPKEMTGTTVRLVDLEASVGAKGNEAAIVRDQLWDEVFAEPSSEMVAYRRGRRWVRNYQKLPLSDLETGSALLRTGGIYLVTGGLGDLALVIARELASRYRARLVLTGRLSLPAREEWDKIVLRSSRNDRLRRAIEAIRELEALGAKVLYFTADVSSLENMKAAVDQARSTFGEIDGVFHAAGTVSDNLIQLKTIDDMEQVLAPKVRGTMVLEELFRERPLGLMVLFSSTSTDIAPAGQADYVAANAYMNAYAESRSSDRDRKTVALHWGIWNDVGLAARAAGRDGGKARKEVHRAAAQGPFFARWVEDEQGDVWLEARISPATHWTLDEHRMVSGKPVMPGTGTIEIIFQALREYDYRREIAELLFMSPLEVGDGEERIVRVRVLTENGVQRVVVTASASSHDGDPGFAVIAEASLKADIGSRHDAADIAAVAARLPDAVRAEEGGTLRSAQEEHIHFGSRWKVLRSQAFGQEEALAELELDRDHAADMAAGLITHPALLDIATGFALPLAPEYAGSNALWAPMSYGRISLFEKLPPRLVSWARLRPYGEPGNGFAAFDVTIANAEGDVVAEIENFVMRRLANDLALVVAPRPAKAAQERTNAPQGKQSAEHLAAQVSQGIRPAEGFEAMLRALATGQSQPIVSSMDLDTLRQYAEQPPRQAEGAGETFARPDIDTEYVEPRNDVERFLAGLWTKLLGVEKIGIHDSFFDIGGHSLIAVRLFREIRNEFAVDLPISALFDAPTIADCAALIARVTGNSASTSPEADGAAQDPEGSPAQGVHLVTISGGRSGGGTPFFICAGMFGNILNLRDLAVHLAVDRPVYGLQARGLFGDQEPHDSIEAMAAGNLAELRRLQPHGPYLLGGFSGGGLVAYEMAQQLLEAGEEVEQLIMLDTPLPTQPPITVLDRLSMKLQDLKRDRSSFISKWIGNRRRWKERVDARAGVEQQSEPSEEANNIAIENAFRGALPKYKVRIYPGKVLLLRPRLNILYRLPDGRALQDGRNIALDDNGWTPYVGKLTVEEVAGDHDSMVLEPFVRILSDKIRKRLADSRRDMTFGIAAE